MNRDVKCIFFCFKRFNGKGKIGEICLRTMNHLDKAMGVIRFLSKEDAGDKGENVLLRGVNYFKIPAFKKARFPFMTMK